MENPIIDPDYVPPYTKKSTDMSIGDWVLTLILTAIPLVGFVCLIVWAVSSSPEKRSRTPCSPKLWAAGRALQFSKFRGKENDCKPYDCTC